VFADTLVLNNGTKLNLVGMEDDMIMVLNGMLQEGMEGENVLETLKAFAVAGQHDREEKASKICWNTAIWMVCLLF
jgi:hypothetical protein